MDVRLIAAVGKSGQLGLGDALPWKDPEDLAWFKSMTDGSVVIVGMNTYKTLPRLPNRIVIPFANRQMKPSTFLLMVDRLYPNQVLWIAGGAKTYAAFLPFVRRSFITHVDYDGPADVYMPPLWNTENK